MDEPTDVPTSVSSILVTRLDALGDIVLGTMLLSGLHAKWPDATIRLLVRPQMTGVAALLPDWVHVTPFPFDPREPIGGKEQIIIEQLRAFAAEVKSDLAIVAEYNRTWAGEIIAEISGAPIVFAFDGPSGLNFLHHDIRSALGIASLERWKTVHVESDEHEPAKYAKLLNALGPDGQTFAPSLVVRDEDRHAAAALWTENGADPQDTVVCFPSSGEQLVRSLDPPAWSRWIARLRLSRPVVLLGTEADQAVIDAIKAVGLPPGVKCVTVPMEKVGVTAAFLERCGAYIGMDTGPMHIAAVLGRPTFGVFGGGHRAARFLPVGKRAAAVRMPLGCFGCEWFCPFDSRLCIKEIPEWPLCEACDEFLNEALENADPFSPRVFDISPPADLPAVLLGPIMRQHRQFLKSNHQSIEHHAYLARVNAQQQTKIEELNSLLTSVASQNHERGQAIAQLSSALAEMTRHNSSRDQAIDRFSTVLAEMTTHNSKRDQAIAHLNQTLTEMTRQNAGRDAAIQFVNQALEEMTRQNEARDEKIAAKRSIWSRK